MHPLDTKDRQEELKGEISLGYCNITKKNRWFGHGLFRSCRNAAL